MGDHVHDSVSATAGSMGVGSLILFIAMILVAGIAASVLLQTMDSLQKQAVTTGEETVRDITSGLRVTHVCGYSNGTAIVTLAVFLEPSVASEPVDLSTTVVALSDASTKVLLSYDGACYSDGAAQGLFGTVNASNLSSATFGLIVVRDIDSSCTASSPVLNGEDLVVVLVNTTDCFAGISPRTEVAGMIYPELGIAGIVQFRTPSTYTSTIIDL